MATSDWAVKESDIQRTIMDYLRLKRVFFWRNNTGAFQKEHKGKTHFVRFGTLGCPDIIAIWRGLCYGIEVKGPRGFQSQYQIDFQVNFEAVGGKYILARRLEDVSDVIL